MDTLAAGATAPDFALDVLDGKKFSLREALTKGPVILAFFKVSCPTCQYAFPFLERLYRSHQGKMVSVVGVSQNNSKDTAAFAREFGISFPLLLDDTRTYPVSNAYGLTNVPSTFWIAQDGEVEIASIGWVKADFEQLNRRLAEAAQIAVTPLFQPDEQVRDFRAG
jgi:peroxiredoxin